MHTKYWMVLISLALSDSLENLSLVVRALAASLLLGLKVGMGGRFMELRPITSQSTAHKRGLAVALSALAIASGSVTFVKCGSGTAHLTLPEESASEEQFEVEVLPGEVAEPELSGQEGFRRLVESAAVDFEGGSLELPSPDMQPAPMPLDPKFCDGLSYGECLTLVVQIPGAQLQIDPGLSALNLLESAPGYKGLLGKACGEGLMVGTYHLANRAPGRHRVLGKVQRTRCVFQALTDESTVLPALAENEFGFSVRLIGLELLSKSSSTAPALGTIDFSRNQLQLRFHDAKVFGQGKWQPVRGARTLWNVANYSGIFGTARASISFDQTMKIDFDAAGASAYLSGVIAPLLESARKGEGLGELAGEILVIRQAAAAIAAGSNPVVPALILIGVAFDAVRDLCEHEASDCSIKNSDGSVRDAFANETRNGYVIPSETRAVLFNGLKHVPFAVLQGLMQHANFNELETSLNLPTKPFWVAR
jgi:hypothetical protein